MKNSDRYALLCKLFLGAAAKARNEHNRALLQDGCWRYAKLFIGADMRETGLDKAVLR